MKNTVFFLQAITNKLPSCPQNHNLTLNSEGKLRITIFYEDNEICGLTLDQMAEVLGRDATNKIPLLPS